jgi:hypothetical protein
MTRQQLFVALPHPHGVGLGLKTYYVVGCAEAGLMAKHPDPVFWTMTGAADLLHRDRNTVKKALQNVQPDKRLGAQLFYQPHTIVTALLNYETRDVGKSNGKLLTERDRLTKARREQIEMENAVRAGELVEVSTLEEYICGCYALFREKCLSFAGELCMELGLSYADEDLEPKIRKKVYAMMSELATLGLWEKYFKDHAIPTKAEDEQQVEEDHAQGRL